MKREQYPNTQRNEVAVLATPSKGTIYMCQPPLKGLKPTEFVWLDGLTWDLEAFLMAQRDTRFTH